MSVVQELLVESGYIEADVQMSYLVALDSSIARACSQFVNNTGHESPGLRVSDLVRLHI